MSSKNDVYHALVKAGCADLAEEVEEIFGGINDPYIFKAVFTAGGAGSGKCLRGDTPVIMHDGSTKNAKDIKRGDVLMGDDSGPRNVKYTHRGIAPMYKIVPVKGESFVCSEGHILTLKVPVRKKVNGRDTTEGYKIEEISVKEYLKKSKRYKQKAKLYRTGVEFETNKDLPVAPYLLGLWLGDGHQNTTGITTADHEVVQYLREVAEEENLQLREAVPAGSSGPVRAYFINSGKGGKNNSLLNKFRSLDLIHNKHIPLVYKSSDRKQRLNLLAGLVDSDGYVSSSQRLEITQKKKSIADDIAFLARSLGFAAYVKEKRASIKDRDYESTAYRVGISGDLSEIPTRITRKKGKSRHQVKNVLHTGFNIEYVGTDAYYGFEVDGNQRHLLGDFTVTHNSWIADHMFKGLGMKFVNSDKAFEYFLRKKGLSLKLDMEDERYQNAREDAKTLTKLQENNWINGMLGLVLDGTGKDFNRVKGAAEGLRNIGYDVGMAFVNTTLEVALNRNKERERTVPEDVVTDLWSRVQQNMGKFQSYFGKSNFFVIDNSQTLDKKEIQRLGKELRGSALTWLRRPIKNPLGKRVINQLQEIGGKELSDLRDDVLERAA